MNKNQIYNQDILFEQMTAISKAAAYDAISPEYSRLKDENEKIKRLLHDLTPGGSEFYNDPEYCAKWIRDNRTENHYSLAKIIAELKGENAQLAIKLNGAESRVKALQDFINEVRPEAATKMEIANSTKYQWPELEQEIEQEGKDRDDLKNIEFK